MAVTPERILDTRDPTNLGLPGPFVSQVSQKLQVTGSIPTATGTKVVVPAGATGVLLNVTSVGSTANGFISVRPGDATGTPTTSSLNVNAGVIVPNSVQVAMPTAGANAGKIDITWDAFGVAGPTTDILIDVVGYTTNTGLQQLVADVAAKASNVEASHEAWPTAVVVAGGDQSVSVDGTGQVLRTVTLTPPVMERCWSCRLRQHQQRCWRGHSMRHYDRDSQRRGLQSGRWRRQSLDSGRLSGVRGFDTLQLAVPLTVNLVLQHRERFARRLFDSNWLPPSLRLMAL